MGRFDDKPFNAKRNGRVILFNPGATNDFLHIYYAGITLPSPTYRVLHNTGRANAYHMYTFEYIISGTGYIEADGQTRRVTRGDLFFLHRDRKQIYYSDPTDPLHKVFIALCGSLVDGLVATYRIDESVLVTQYDCEERFYELFDMLENNSADLHEIALLLHRFIQRLKPPLPIRAGESGSTTAGRIREYIDANLQKELGLAKLAERFHISESAIIRSFKREFGLSPIQYVLRQRMNKAAFLLRQSDLKIYEISEMFGYDSKTFSKRFTQVIGCSPRAYKAGGSGNT